MAIKFEKKVIIGSLFSFAATAIGIIAVFFPDLLNLQKSRIETLIMDVITDQDVEKFHAFLEKRSKDGKVFELDVVITGSRTNNLMRSTIRDGVKYVNPLDEVGFSEKIHTGDSLIHYAENTGGRLDPDFVDVNFNFGKVIYQAMVGNQQTPVHWWYEIESLEKSFAEIEDYPQNFPNPVEDNSEVYGFRSVFSFPHRYVIRPTEGNYTTETRDLLNGKLKGDKLVQWDRFVGIKGTFYVNDENPQYFVPVSKEQLKMKNY